MPRAMCWYCGQDLESTNLKARAARASDLKDMPGNEDTPGLVIGATLSRDAASDVLVLRPGLGIDEFKSSRGKGFRSQGHAGQRGHAGAGDRRDTVARCRERCAGIAARTWNRRI